MPALPVVVDSQILARGLVEASHVIVRRAVDHSIVETIAVSMFSQHLWRLSWNHGLLTNKQP